MSYTQAVLVIVLGVAASVVFSYAIHRLVHVEARRRHQDVGVAVFLQLGVLFSVLLAFVFSEAYSEYGAAQQAIDLECAALHGVSMMASTLPVANAKDFLSREANYVQDVVEGDWPTMRQHRRGSDVAAASLAKLVTYAAQLDPTDPHQSSLKGILLGLLASAHAQREVRLYQAGNGLPAVLWTVLIGLGAVLTAFVAFSSVEKYKWLAVFGATFAACVSAILALVRLLDYPFEGAIALRSDDFVATLGKVNALLHGL